jgi:hypothetical protein
MVAEPKPRQFDERLPRKLGTGFAYPSFSARFPACVRSGRWLRGYCGARIGPCVNAGEMQRLAGVKVQREREQQGTGYWPARLSRLRARSVSS